MSRMQQAIQKLKGYKAGTVPQLPIIEHYLLTGVGLDSIQKDSDKTWPVRHALQGALPPPTALEDEDRRALHVLVRIGYLEALGVWLDRALGKEKPDEDYHALLRAELEAIKVPRAQILHLTGRNLHTFARAGKPTSAGRYLLALSDSNLKQAVETPQNQYYNLPLIDFLLEFAPGRIEGLLDELLNPRGPLNRDLVAIRLLKKGGKPFEKPVAAFARALASSWQQFQVGLALSELDPEKYQLPTLKVARDFFRDSSSNAPLVARWMLQTFGTEVLPDVVNYLGRKGTPWFQYQVLTAAVQALGAKALPAVLAYLETGQEVAVRQALPHLIRYGDGSHDEVIRKHLEGGLAATGPRELPQYLTLAGQWNARPLAQRIGELLTHSSRAVRDAAAGALGTLGNDALPRARELLEHGNASSRLAAVNLLIAVNTPEARRLLEGRLDLEPSDDVRDAMLRGLEAAWAAAGRQVTRKDVEARMERAAPKLKNAPARWLNEKDLPPLHYKDGTPLSAGTVRYLLYRQSRGKEIRPDVEARALYDLIDHPRSGDFALALLKAYLGTQGAPADDWALTVAALLGDERIVPLLAARIREWADGNRGKMAEKAVRALALQGSDAALVTIDAMALRYRNKKKNVGQAAVDAFAAAAERLGLSTDELGDRVVPWLGFEPGKPWVIDCGGRRIEVRIGQDFKLKFQDLEKNKAVASLPKTAPKEVQQELKTAAATLREVVKAQLPRLENLMVRQYRWPVARWRELFLNHPVLLPFATRLVWGVSDTEGRRTGTFRALEDRTLTTAADEPTELPASGTVGAIHPLELTKDERSTWQMHLADYEIEPPFPQLERPVVRLAEAQRERKVLDDYRGTTLNGLTFRGRAERLGWSRGEVGDGGSVGLFWKGFGTAGVDAQVGVEGMYIGMGMNEEVRLEDVCFVLGGPQAGRRYSLPRSEDDPRLLTFADVPPVVYSEVMGDLRKITAQKVGTEAEAAQT
jgi:hypothetical protein